MNKVLALNNNNVSNKKGQCKSPRLYKSDARVMPVVSSRWE